MAHSHIKNNRPDIGQIKANKFSKTSILNKKKLAKGISRWNQYYAGIYNINPETLAGPMLDLGCGVGYFVYEGLSRRMNIWGVDSSQSKILRFKRLIHYTASPKKWQKRCIAASGNALPFKSEYFASVCSWYVLEHLEKIDEALKEIVRVTRRKGIIVLRAQDARNGWEGHCNIPWIPFLSDRLVEVWVEEFGAPFEKRQGVYDITQPQVEAILETFECEIVTKAPPPETLIKNHWQIHTEKEVRKTAREIKARFEDKQWFPQPENLYIFAVKK